MLRVTGTVVRYEQTPWTMEGRTGIKREARVLVGKADFVDVRIAEDKIPPREGDAVDWACVAVVSGNKVQVKSRGDWAAIIEPQQLHAVGI